MVVRVIEGRVRRRPNNALHMLFLDLEIPDPDQPTDFVELGDIAAVAQCGNSGRGTKMKILLGWRNGGPGEHVLTYSDGRVLVVAVTDKGATTVTDEAATVLATVSAQPPTVLTGPDGRPLVSFGYDGTGKTTWKYELEITDATGASLGRLHVALDSRAFQYKSATKEAVGLAVALGEDLHALTAGGSGSLPLAIAGTRLLLDRPVTGPEQDALLGACVDIAIGKRRYSDELPKPR